MKKHAAIVDALLDEDLSNLFPQRTGLRQVVWFSADPQTRHSRPRGKVLAQGKLYPFSLDEPIQWLTEVPPGVSAKSFARIAAFVRLNREVLLAHWRGEIDSGDLSERIKKV